MENVILAPKLWETQALTWWQTGWGGKDVLCCLSVRSGNPRASKTSCLSCETERSEDVSLGPIIQITWSGVCSTGHCRNRAHTITRSLQNQKKHPFLARTTPWEETPARKEPFQMTVSRHQIHWETKADSKVHSLHQAGNEILYRAHHLECIPIILKCCRAQITHSAIK